GVYAYSRSRGLFAGVALDGTAITIDERGNRAFYDRRDVLPSDIMGGAVETSSENARRFLAALARSTGEAATQAPAATPAAPAPVQPGPGAGSITPGEVPTFPLE